MDLSCQYSLVSADTSRETNIDEVCTLLRSTGYSSAVTAKRPTNYPEDYFRRIKFKPHYINMVVGRLRSDDIYHRVRRISLFCSELVKSFSLSVSCLSSSGAQKYSSKHASRYAVRCFIF